MRTWWNKTAFIHTPVCDDLDALLDLTGELQRDRPFGSDLFIALGKVRMAICDAQGVAERSCQRIRGTNDR